MLLVLLVTLYTSRVVLQQLGVDDFGIYSVVASVVAFLSILQGALNTATSRFITFEIGKGNSPELNLTYSMALNCHFILAFVLFILLELVGVWFLNNHLNISQDRMYAANVVFQISLVMFCVQVMSSPLKANIIAHEKMDFYAVVGIVEALLQLAVALLLSYSPYDKLITYAFLLLCVAIINILMVFVYCVYCIKDVRYIRCWDSKKIKNFTSYSSWAVLVSGADIAIEQGMSIFFNWFIGVRGNTALGISNKVNSGFNMFVTNFTTAYKPQLIKSYASGETSYFMKLIFSASKFSYFLLFLVSVSIICNLEYVLDIWLGKGMYPEPVLTYVKIVLLYFAFDAFQYPLVASVHATGKIKKHQIMIGTIKILTLPLSYLVFYLGWGGAAALSVWAGLNGVCAIARTMYMKRLINRNVLDYCKEVVIKLIVLSVVVLSLSWKVATYYGYGIKALLVSTLVSTTLSFMLCYFYLLNKQEKVFVKSILTKFKTHIKHGSQVK